LEHVPLFWINRVLMTERLEAEAAAHHRRAAERQQRAVAWQQERMQSWR